MALNVELSIPLVFFAGVLTASSPCVLPIVPPLLAGSMGHRLRPLLIVLGVAAFFTLMGGVFSALGIITAGNKESMRVVFASFIMAMGAVMADNDLREAYIRRTSILTAKAGSFLPLHGHARNGGPASESGLVGAFFLGISLGIIWIPCVGLILGSVLSYTVYQGNVLKGSLLLLTYSLGLGVPMLAIAYGGKSLSPRLAWVKKNSRLLERLAGWVLILTGLAVLFGIDRLVQGRLLTYFFDYEYYLLKLFQ